MSKNLVFALQRTCKFQPIIYSCLTVSVSLFMSSKFENLIRNSLYDIRTKTNSKVAGKNLNSSMSMSVDCVWRFTFLCRIARIERMAFRMWRMFVGCYVIHDVLYVDVRIYAARTIDISHLLWRVIYFIISVRRFCESWL